MNSMIIEQLKKANVIDSTGKVTLANLATYTLTHDILVVMYDGTVNNITGTYLRAVIEKWTFQDKAMGEQFITFDFLSEKPVAWAINDYCLFRGERFVLNYIPSVTQKGRRNAVLDSYKYEGVKLNSLADELTRCQMLDVVLTSGDPDQGTNYTGSSKFDLFCGETTVMIDDEPVVRTAVMTLGDRILANLNRMYGENVWSIVYGNNTHTEDQQLSFDNQYVSEALAEVKNKFDLNYAVKGRTIYIGCELGDVAGIEYGFGPGYPTDEAGGKGLFELKKISDSSQQIVTRLRVLGSTKNLPYRYYNNAYPLPQALFPLNLQLPDTFLPEGSPSDPAGANTKWGHNKQRSSQLRAVKGATNDSYIDKNDDAAGTTEGIREATIRFDGSDSKLEEIYPTIENVTYDELRGSNVPDQDGNTGPGAYPNYESDEKVNEILAIGYKYDGQMFDDANIGSGILSENNGGQAGSIRDISIARRLDGIYTRVSDYFCGTEQILFTVAGQTAGRYFFTPVMSKEPYFFYSPASVKDRIGFIIRVKATSGGITTTIAEYKSDFYSGHNALALPSIPDVFYMMDAQVREIALSGTADITVTFIPCAKASTDILYGVGPKPNSSYTAQYVWNSVDHMDSSGMPFHFFVKDMGFDFAAQFNGETPTIVMKSGDCVGREFQIGQSIEKVEYQGKKGYMLTLNRASDSSLNTYYPNSRNQISADDQFVITGIDMPDAYIKAAEMRLLAAATEWLAENGNTNFHYQPTIDDFYLKRNYENMVKAGTPQDSVFWKIYAGYDLTFHPIPDNPSDPEPEAISVAIESVTITMGEGLTRKVDILLNDELKESTLKRVSREVKDLSNKIQRTGSGMSTATMETAIRTIGDKQYLSKVENDTAAGDITFNGNIRFNKNALFAQGAYFGENLDGSFNTEIDPLGNIHTARNVEAMWGVSAFGIANMAISGTGGGGTVTAVSVNGTRYTPSNGLITLPDYPSLDGYATENYVASYFDANFTQLNIKNTLGISDWALASTKPSYNFSEIGAKPSTLGGYGISDAHITNGEITLGQNTITPATLNNGKIPLSQIPDAILGQMLYGGTVNGSGVVTLSQNAKDKWGITSLTLTSTNYADYEGAFFIASANGSSGVPSSLGVLVGDWIIATSAGWGKIDNTDAVTGVKGNAESSYRIGNVNITPANIGLGNVENTALSTWVGTNNITTLGTITTGVWNGSAIGYNYLASGVQASLDKADTALQQESDPIFTASAAHGITSNDISTWNAKQNALAFDGTYDASTNKVATKSTVTNAINALDVSNITGFGADKTLASLTETDGKIAATFQDISITKSQVSDFPTTWALADVTGADDLKAIEALTGTSGFLKKTAADTWALDTDVASGTALSDVSTRVGTLEGYFSNDKLNSANIDLATGDNNGQVKIAGTNVSVKGWNTAATHAHGDYVTAVGIDATNGKLKWYLGGVAQTAPDIVAARLVDTNKTMFGNTYWTSSGIPASIGTATAPAALDYVTNIDGLLYFDKTNRKVEVGTSASPADLCSMGGVSAMGIANLSINSGGGQGTLTQIKVNGTAIADVNGVVNITATTGNANGKIAIAGQQIPVYGLGTLAYASSLSFDNLSSHPTTLGGYGITDANIANGVITLGGNTITPLTGITSSMVTTALGYTPYDAANFTQANIKSTLGISDWALAANKPSYTHNEIGAGNLAIGDGANTIFLRTNGSWASGIYHNTSADEAVVFLNRGLNVGGTANYTTSWIFAYGTPSDRPSWTGLTPALQIKGQSVVINKLLGSQVGASYNLDVNGTLNATTIYQNGTALATVATSGSYNDLSDKPTIPTVNNGNLYLQASGTTKVTFTANQSGNSTFNIATGSTNGTLSIGGTDVAVKGLGNSAYIGYDTAVTKDSTNLITSGAVWTAIDNLPEPMVFKGSLGTGGTITALPVNGIASIGDTYKVITAGTYASKAAKVGDTFICLTKTSSANTWELIPSGDEPSGTVTSVGLSMPTGFSVSSSPVTSSGTLTVAFASGYSLPTTAKQGNWDDAYDKRHTHSSLTLSTTAQAYDGTHTLALPASDPYTSARTPSSHASSGTDYGVGTTSNYGHVKLATGDMNGASGEDGVACGKNHTHSQYGLASDVTTLQGYFTSGVANKSAVLYNGTVLDTSAKLDAFHEAYTLKYAVWNGFNTSVLNANGLVIDGGYTSTSYGFQILIDDDPTYVMALRQKSTSGWSAWKRIPMGDGTGASGTWGISVTGDANGVRNYNGSRQTADNIKNLNDGALHYFLEGYGWRIIHTSWDNGGYDTQIAIPDHTLDNESLKWRSLGAASSHDTYEDWRNILDSSNYTDYTVKKDGTGATGSWGINVTGNASTATDADKLDGQHGSYYQPKVSALGSSTQPVYISAAGTFSTCDLSTTYAPYNANGYLPLNGGRLLGRLEATTPAAGDTTISHSVDAIVVGPKSTRPTDANSYYAGIAFNHMLNYNNATTYDATAQGWIGLRLYDTPGSERSYLVFATKNSTSSPTGRPIERMCISPAGNVGIGVTAPAYALDVSGDVRATNFRGALVGNADTATALTTVSKTAWGQTFWTSGGIPASISGDMSNVGNITPSADKQKNLGSESLQFSYVYAHRLITNSGNGLRYCSTTGKHAWYNSYTTDDTTKQMELDANSNLTVQGDVMGMGGVSAMGIASMAINSVSGVAFAQKVTMNGQNYEAYNGAITLPNYTATYNPSNSGSTTEALSQKGAKAMYTAIINSLPSTTTVAGWGYKKGMVYTSTTASDSGIQVATGADPTYQYITNTSQSSLIITVTTSNAAANSYGVHRYIMIYNNRNSATLVQFADQGQGVVGPADNVSIPANSYMEFSIIHPASNAKCMVTWSMPLKDITTM